MNLLLLVEGDFLDASRVRLVGRHREHAVAVLKVGVGEELRVGLLDGNIGTGIVVSITDDALEMDVTLDIPPQPKLPLTLVLALPRPKVLRRCLEAVATMGVERMFIIQSWRVDRGYWANPLLNEASIREHLLLGLEQSGCDTVPPRIEIRHRFRPFVEDELPAITSGTTGICAHPSAGDPMPGQIDGPVTLAVGPEGGFIPYEVEALRYAGLRPASVGPRILRVEQALPAILGRLF